MEAALIALNVITVIILILYYPYVFLNVTFTNNNLSTVDVPYYALPTSIDTVWTDRYKVEWWLLAIDILAIAYPMLAAHTWMPNYPLEDKRRRLRVPTPEIYALAKVVTIGIEAIQVAKLIYRIIMLVPSIQGCQDQMFCRDEDPGETDVNIIYIFVFIFNALIVILGGIYIAYIYIWERRALFILGAAWLTQTRPWRWPGVAAKYAADEGDTTGQGDDGTGMIAEHYYNPYHEEKRTMLTTSYMETAPSLPQHQHQHQHQLPAPTQRPATRVTSVREMENAAVKSPPVAKSKSKSKEPFSLVRSTMN